MKNRPPLEDIENSPEFQNHLKMQWWYPRLQLKNEKVPSKPKPPRSIGDQIADEIQLCYDSLKKIIAAKNEVPVAVDIIEREEKKFKLFSNQCLLFFKRLKFSDNVIKAVANAFDSIHIKIARIKITPNDYLDESCALTIFQTIINLSKNSLEKTEATPLDDEKGTPSRSTSNISNSIRAAR